MLAALRTRRRAERPGAARLLLPRAIEIGEALVAGPGASSAARAPTCELAGSARRQADSVKDLDLIATTTRPTTLAEGLGKLRRDRARQLRGQGAARGRAPTRAWRSTCGSPRPSSSATCCSTSRAPAPTTPRCAKRAVRRGLHVSEYGVLDDATGSTHDVRHRAGGLRAARPRLHRARAAREPRRAAGGRLTRPAGGCRELIELGDIRGDLHSHTIASDGHNTIEEMAQRGARARLRVPGDHRPLGQPRLRQRRSPRRSCAARSSACARSTASLDGHRAAGRQRGQHPARRLARLRGRAARASSTGWSRACTRPSGWASRR